MNTSHFRKITLTAMILALIVIVLGAYVRLSSAGLGCPDWPGCYGQFSAPDNMEEITRAELLYPHKAVESEKAWKEMLHRYLASTLGLLIVGMAIIAWKNRNFIDQQLLLPTLLVGLVIFQGLLGMWTVTLLLKPTIVTLHLLTGLLTLSLLGWCYLKSQNVFLYRAPVNKQLRIWSRLALVILSIQIFLGGWTSTHYVALYCPDFPTCQGQWLPEMDFNNGFVFIRESGINYEGGVLSTEAGTAVHVMHRIGAVLSLLVIGTLAVVMMVKERNRLLIRIATVILIVLTAQIVLGISNVLLYLPIPIAVAHNAGAALLLLSLVFLNYFVTPPQAKGDGYE